MSRLERLKGSKTMAESQRASGRRQRAFFSAAVADESGQTLIWLAASMVLLMGVSAFATDFGRAYLVRKQLQSSADAAALAGAQHLEDGTYASAATAYSGSGTQNGYGGYTINAPTISTRCSTTVAAYGVPCSASFPNMIIVKETATVNTFFAGAIGHKTLTVATTSAAAKGAKPTPYNVAILLDTTNSMTLNDSNCGATQLKCAENAVGVLLNNLDPAIDNVSLFTFPAMSATTAKNDYGCSGTRATGVPYTFPPTNATSLQQMQETVSGTSIATTYQITPFLADYRTSQSATSLNSSSELTKAIGLASGCKSLTPNNTQNTYFAATIYQAQAALDAEQAANPGTSNAMIILSDGNATAQYDTSSFPNDVNKQTSPGPAIGNSSGGAYPNIQGQCGQAVDAANHATSAGTLVYTIAYGALSTSKSSASNTGNCESDVGTGAHSGITPCQTMQQMSSGWNSSPSDKTHFYSDYYDAAQGDTGCQAADQNNGVTNLNKIALAIVTNLMAVRLVSPNAP